MAQDTKEKRINGLNKHLFKYIMNNLIKHGFISSNFSFNYLTLGYSSEVKIKINSKDTTFLLKVNFQDLKNQALKTSKQVDISNKFAKNIYAKHLNTCSYCLYQYIEGEVLNTKLEQSSNKEQHLLALKLIQLLEQFNKEQTREPNISLKEIIAKNKKQVEQLKQIQQKGVTNELDNIITQLVSAFESYFMLDQDYIQLGLSHGDFHLSNIIVTKHNKLQLIDYLKLDYSYKDKDLVNLCLMNYEENETFIIMVLKMWFEQHNINAMKELRLSFIMRLIGYLCNNYNKSNIKINNLKGIISLFDGFKKVNPFEKEELNKTWEKIGF